MKIGKFEISWKKSYKQFVAFLNGNRGLITSKNSVQTQLNEYKSWQYSAVSLIYDRISIVPFGLYNKDTNEEITSRNHAYKTIMKPFLQPNYFMSFRFIKAFCQLQLDMCGMACIYKARNVLGQIWEFWPLNMNDFSRILDINGNPIETNTNVLPSEVFYEFYIGGKRYFFTSRELILLYYPHPKNPCLFASPIQAQAYTIDIDHYIEVYERDFFGNSARVDMVLETDETLTEDTAKEIKYRWKEKFQGNFHDIVVLDSGIKPVPLNYTNKDFEFLSLANWSQDKILSAYRVPKEKLGISSQGSNRSNSVYVDIGFNRECIQPRLNLWDEELTKEVINEFDSRYYLKHNDPIPRDRQLEYQESRVYLAGVPSITINEDRKIKKLKPVDGGDIILVPANFIPLDLYEEYAKNNLVKPKELENPKIDPFTDPMHHEDDKPHLNPDGTDNRDDLPTDERNFDLIENDLKILWYNYFKEHFKNLNKDNFKEDLGIILENLFMGTVKTLLKLSNQISITEDRVWILSYCKKLCDEIDKTLKIVDIENKQWGKFCVEQLDLNSRISKICSVALRSCINYTKYLIICNNNLEKVWVIDRNICCHRGRLDKFITFGKFKIKDSEIRFPGEIFNLSCDCKITTRRNFKEIE